MYELVQGRHRALPIDPPISSYSDYIDYSHLLLLGLKADTQFTITQRIDG